MNKINIPKMVNSPIGPTTVRGIKLFGDGAGLEEFTQLQAQGRVTGFTTNPTLMHRARIADYEAFARQLIEVIPDLPISFEVFSDDFDEMRRQALKIAAWGPNVYVKVPITNTRRDFEPAAGARPFARRRQTECHRDPDAGAGGRRRRLPGRGHARHRLGVRRAHRRHRRRSDADHARGRGHRGAQTPGRGPVGQPPRGAEHPPGARLRLPHHHRHAGDPEQARHGRQGPGGPLPGDRRHVPPRRRRGRDSSSRRAGRWTRRSFWRPVLAAASARWPATCPSRCCRSLARRCWRTTCVGWRGAACARFGSTCTLAPRKSAPPSATAKASASRFTTSMSRSCSAQPAPWPTSPMR